MTQMSTDGTDFRDFGPSNRPSTRWARRLSLEEACPIQYNSLPSVAHIFPSVHHERTNLPLGCPASPTLAGGPTHMTDLPTAVGSRR